MYLFCSKTRNFRKENGIFCLIITLWKIIHKTALNLHRPEENKWHPEICFSSLWLFSYLFVWIGGT